MSDPDTIGKPFASVIVTFSRFQCAINKKGFKVTIRRLGNGLYFQRASRGMGNSVISESNLNFLLKLSENR
jgi:hypothetical protein